MPRPQVGDTLVYSTFSGAERTIEVTAVFDNVKNDQPGFEGTLIETTGTPTPDGWVWGYDSQIIRVIPKEN